MSDLYQLVYTRPISGHTSSIPRETFGAVSEYENCQALADEYGIEIVLLKCHDDDREYVATFEPTTLVEVEETPFPCEPVEEADEGDALFLIECTPSVATLERLREAFRTPGPDNRWFYVDPTKPVSNKWTYGEPLPSHTSPYESCTACRIFRDFLSKPQIAA